MSSLQIAETIVKLRQEKGITQSELASFLGVTKASVSKWETRQSYPDILLIPQIATFFNITTDELFGYAPELSPEQIQTHYMTLSLEFTTLPFDEVIKKCEKLTKEYYSCYPFLYQMALLYLNHFSFAENTERQMEILKICICLCDRIIKDCHQLNLKEDAHVIKAMATLQSGNPEGAIEILTPLADPKQLRNTTDTIFIQAYQMMGDTDRAEYHCQICVYSHLLQLISNSTVLLSLYMRYPDFCEETISRLEQIIDSYKMDVLHPNVCLQFYYQATLFYSGLPDKGKALSYLKRFTYNTLTLLDGKLELHGDSYFTRIDEWIQALGINAHAPREKKTVAAGALQAFTNPAFSCLSGYPEYHNMKSELERRSSS